MEILKKLFRSLNDYSQLNDLQKAEEMIKSEMLSMLSYDALQNPIENPLKKNKGLSGDNAVQTKKFLDKNPYEKIDKKDLEIAKKILDEEMSNAKRNMGHGELPYSAYVQVWEECLAQILYLPSQNRYTRASLASKKDRLDAAEKLFEQNRAYMTHEAKRATKLEKKLRILTTGYNSKAQTSLKRIQDLYDQIDEAALKLDTFKFLEEQEHLALPRRIEILEADIRKQIETEQTLRDQYAHFVNRPRN